MNGGQRTEDGGRWTESSKKHAGAAPHHPWLKKWLRIFLTGPLLD